jgi:hypothetical protein
MQNYAEHNDIKHMTYSMIATSKKTPSTISLKNDTHLHHDWKSTTRKTILFIITRRVV